MKEITREEKEANIAANSDAWFAVRLVLGMLAIHYAFGTLAAIAFMAGWWWGTRDRGSPPEDVKLDDLL